MPDNARSCAKSDSLLAGRNVHPGARAGVISSHRHPSARLGDVRSKHYRLREREITRPNADGTRAIQGESNDSKMRIRKSCRVENLLNFAAEFSRFFVRV